MSEIVRDPKELPSTPLETILVSDDRSNPEANSIHPTNDGSVLLPDSKSVEAMDLPHNPLLISNKCPDGPSSSDDLVQRDNLEASRQQTDSKIIPETNPTSTKINVPQRVNPLLKEISPHILKPFGLEKVEIPVRTLRPDIYFYNKGYRFVYPYYHNFVTHCKGRWIGKTLPEVFTQEFKQYTEESVREAMRVGKIRINSKVVLSDTPLQNGDFIENKIHRHEMPVKDDSIKFLQMESAYFVVDKPASVPVHPCGFYRMGSLTHILENEYGMKINTLFPVHRLDRLTSGILIIARTKAMATALAARIADHGIVKKCYLARVKGSFPSEDVTPFDGDLAQLDKRERAKWCVVPHGEGKPCRTLFTPVKYLEDSDETIVMCSPVTGRTHQIRVHLMTMGFPITNDPNYGPIEIRREFKDRFEYFLNDAQKAIFEEEKEKYGRSQQENSKKRLCVGSSEEDRVQVPVREKAPTAMEILLKYAHLDDSELYKDWQFGKKEHEDPHCVDCKLVTLPRSENDNMIYLHSYGYEVSGIKVFSSIPSWAPVSMEEAEKAWERIKSWKNDETQYSKLIAEYSLKKSWKKRR